MKIVYTSILKDAWAITSKNKILWFFGIFASFLSLESVYEILLAQFNLAQSSDFLQTKILNLYYLQNFYLNQNLNALNQLLTSPADYLAFTLIAFLILLFIWWAYSSQIFIIKSVWHQLKNKKVTTTSIISVSQDKFWSVLSVNILNKLIIYAGWLAFSLPLYYSLLVKHDSAIWSANLFFFLLFTIFAMVISFLTAYATNFIVLHHLPIIKSISEAWKLFSRNIALSLELAFILFLLKILSLIIIFSLFIIFLVPFSALFILALGTYDLAGMVMSATVIILAFTLISLFINSIYTVFFLATWTITYTELTENYWLGHLEHQIRLITDFIKKTILKYNLKIDKDELQAKSKDLAIKLKTDYEKYEPIIAKDAAIATANLKSTYYKYEPVAKKQAKIAAKKLKAAYLKYEPQLKKEVIKMMAAKKKTVVSKRKTTIKK
jgi:hypothetical protein